MAAGCVAGTLMILDAGMTLGAPVSPRVLMAVAGASTLGAAAAAAMNVALLWRLPPIVAFDRACAVECDAAESAAIRAAAHVRGDAGGAGYVHRWALVLPAATWAAVALQSAALLFAGERPEASWTLLVIALGAALVVLFPARPFVYVEGTDGRVLVHPPLVALRVAQRHAARRPGSREGDETGIV